MKQSTYSTSWGYINAMSNRIHILIRLKAVGLIDQAEYERLNTLGILDPEAFARQVAVLNDRAKVLEVEDSDEKEAILQEDINEERMALEHMESIDAYARHEETSNLDSYRN